MTAFSSPIRHHQHPGRTVIARVGNVVVFGAGQYAMRVWLDPDKMKARGLNASDVVGALQQQNSQVTAGQIGAPPAPDNVAFQYTLNVSGRLSDPEEFANVIVKTGAAGEIARVRDIGKVELGAQTTARYSRSTTSLPRASAYSSRRAPALEVEKAVEAKMAALALQFPQDIKYDTPFDTTKFVSESIKKSTRP
jgi:HAE1 family hydrophobic/amphiphilic exporter-1